MIRSAFVRSLAGAGATVLFAFGAQAQTSGATIEAQRAMVTRAELTTKLSEIDVQVNSPAYSKAFRDARLAEADVIRTRLKNGDLGIGDVIHLVIVGEPGWSKDYSVTTSRTIVLPGNAELPVAGLLRSELSDSIASKLKTKDFFVDPIVTATSSISLEFSGALGKIGYYTAPATELLRLVLMNEGGGIKPESRIEKSQIKRNGVVVLDGTEFAAAIRDSKTLDQLNVQAGDEISIATKPAPKGSVFMRGLGILGAIGAAASGYFLIRSIL